MTPGDIVDDAERDGRDARAGDVAIARRRQRSHPGHARTIHAVPLRRPAALRRAVGGLGLLQIPPMDLGQVEVIKGVASSLYGAGAMGGVVNLISRRPGREPRARIAREPLDPRRRPMPCCWYATPLSPDGASRCSAAAIGRQQTDVNDDAWADLPGYARGVVRPRVSGMAATGARSSRRPGCTSRIGTAARCRRASCRATGVPYAEALDTRRVDAGAVGQTLIGGAYSVAVRAAPSRNNGTIISSARSSERDRHDTAFGEADDPRRAGRHTWVGGAAVEREAYRPRDLPQFALHLHVPGVFVQDDVDVAHVAVAERERPARSSQRIRHVLQSARSLRSCAPARGTAGSPSAPASSDRRR